MHFCSTMGSRVLKVPVPAHKHKLLHAFLLHNGEQGAESPCACTQTQASGCNLLHNGEQGAEIPCACTRTRASGCNFAAMNLRYHSGLLPISTMGSSTLEASVRTHKNTHAHTITPHTTYTQQHHTHARTRAHTHSHTSTTPHTFD
jgi:uncharacterized protein YchJ